VRPNVNRVFSSKASRVINLDPNWLTGFSDAEGCFSVIITKRPNKTWRVIVSFEINLHTKDIAILHLIKEYLGVGLVSSRLNKTISVFRVTNIEDLIKVIIPHFTKYPLITDKYCDFLLWSKVVQLISIKQHLTSTGFNTILTHYASINRGVSSTVSAAFPNIIGVERDKFNLPDNLNPNWVSGFTAGDGGFSINVRQGAVLKQKVYFSFRFHVAQHSRDILLMRLFIKFFGCGAVNIRSTSNRCDFCVQDLSKIYGIIIPHFETYPLLNIKTLDFLDFKKAAELYKFDKVNSCEAINNIRNNMNSKREHD